MQLKELVCWLDEHLNLKKYSGDYSNNGLQVEGASEVRKAVFGVDACQELFDFAAERQADFVFVHHGISWGSEPRRFDGITARRLRTLFTNNISLYAAHLPLDAHPELGNNAQIADLIGLQERVPFFEYCGLPIGFSGTLPAAAPAAVLADFLDKKLNVFSERYGDFEDPVKKIAVVSGGGGLDSLAECAGCGCDLLVTGEFEHVMFHPAKELGIKVLALGHYASETTGPAAVMERVRNELGLQVEFADIPTGL